MPDDSISEGEQRSATSWAVVTGPETQSVGSMVDIRGLRIASDTRRSAGSVTDDVSSIQVGDSNSVASSMDFGTFEEVVPPPPTPTTLQIVIIGQDLATLAWEYSNPLKAECFVIERGSDETTFVEVGSVGVRNVYFTDGAVEADSTYYYRVRAKHGDLVSDPSNVVKVKTLEVYKPREVIPEPLPPAKLNATNGSEYSQAVIEWMPYAKENLEDVKVFHVIRSRDYKHWEIVGKVGPEETQFIDTVDWEVSEVYYYWVAAVNIGGDPSYERHSTVTYTVQVNKPSN